MGLIKERTNGTNYDTAVRDQAGLKPSRNTDLCGEKVTEAKVCVGDRLAFHLVSFLGYQPVYFSGFLDRVILLTVQRNR